MNQNPAPTDLWVPSGHKKNKGEQLFNLLQDWSQGFSNLTLVKFLLSPLHNPIDPILVGGLLRFTGSADTLSILTNWSSSSQACERLAELSHHLLLEFPEVETPSFATRIQRTFPDQVNQNYLACMLSTRRAVNVSTSDQLKVTAWRVWLLCKSLEFAASGTSQDQSLKDACGFTRMALDDQGDPRKCQWLLTLLRSCSYLAEYELQLGESIKRTGQDHPAGAEDLLRAIKYLLENRRRPIKSAESNTGFVWPGTEQPPIDLNKAVGVNPLTEDEDDAAEPDLVDVDEDQSFGQVERQARGISLQTAEDLHYLPWAWNRLREDELKGLKQLIKAALESKNTEKELLGAISHIALSTSNSIETAGKIELSSEIRNDWTLDLETGCLRRLAPRRQNRWKVTAEAANAVQPTTDNWSFHLQGAIAEVLRTAHSAQPNAKQLADLWSNKEKTLLASFISWCKEKPGLSRVTSGLLTKTFQQQVFEQEHDATFARMLSSHERSALPGACAYASWSAKKVNSVIATTTGLEAAVWVPTANALGSELNPDDQLLAQALRKVRAATQAYSLQPQAWVKFHNHFSAYCVMVLLAATGARPVRSIFESSAQFDWQRGLLYIEDKVSDLGVDLPSGRVIPLPSLALEFVKNQYLPYLSRLADALPPELAEFATEIRAQAQMKGSSKLPLFFHLRNEPDFQWMEISELSITHTVGKLCELPLNLFRHRMATRLREHGLDPELIDAQLGHQEAGAPTYGDYSDRCWQDDLPQWRDALQSSIQALNLDASPLAADSISNLNLKIPEGYVVFPASVLIGTAQRAQNRKAHAKKVEQAAHEEIEKFIASRPIATISPEQWEALARQMLLTENNLRQPNATLRYEVFERYLRSITLETACRPRIKKWVASLPKARSFFAADSLHANTTIAKALQQLVEVSTRPSTISKALSALLGAMRLALEQRVANSKLLLDLVNLKREQFRLVVFQKQNYLEYSPFQPVGEDVPTQRFVLSRQTAKLISRGLSSKKEIEPQTYVAVTLQPFSESLGISWNQTTLTSTIIASVTKIVDSDNVLIFPGIVAGYLAGRVPSYALNHMCHRSPYWSHCVIGI